MPNVKPIDDAALKDAGEQVAPPTKLYSKVRPPNRLLLHMYNTYLRLRICMGGLAFLLPVIVVGGHALAHKAPTERIRGSLSAYYNAGTIGYFFVGALFSVGAALMLYEGYTIRERIAVNVAGACAIGVAMIPYDSAFLRLRLWTYADKPFYFTPHGACAVTLFLLLAYVAVRRAQDTLYAYTSPYRAGFESGYRYCAYGMAFGSIGAWIVGGILHKGDYATLIIEVVAVWSFAAFWALKSYEMWLRTRRDRAALEAAPW